MRGISLLFLVIPAFGQFTSLRTTYDGSKLYFSSLLTLTGSTDENTYEKIFVYDSTGFHLSAQVERISDTSSPPVSTSYYHLLVPYVSADGSITGYASQADCSSGCSPISIEPPSRTTIHLPGGNTVTLPHRCDVSGNAKYAACLTGRIVQPNPVLIDVATGVQLGTGGACSSLARHIVSSDGRAVSWVLGRVRVYNASESIDLPGEFDCEVMISDDGSRVVGLVQGALLVFDTAKKTAITLASVTGSLQSISADGSLVLTLVDGQAILSRTDGTRSVTLASGIATAELSGDGRTVFALATSGALLKIDVALGMTTELNGATPLVQVVRGGASAGSLNSALGLGLSARSAAASSFPLSTSLEGVTLIVGGIAAPILSVSPTAITFQLPWELPDGDAKIEVTHPPSAFAAPPITMRIQPVQAYSELARAINPDFTVLNDPGHPVNAGDIVHFYLTGLGPTVVAVPDGAITASAPLPFLKTSVRATSAGDPVDVMYAGLAPGLIGIYQVSLRTPATVHRNPLLPNGGPVQVSLRLLYGDAGVDLPVVWMIPNSN